MTCILWAILLALCLFAGERTPSSGTRLARFRLQDAILLVRFDRPAGYHMESQRPWEGCQCILCSWAEEQTQVDQIEGGKNDKVLGE